MFISINSKLYNMDLVAFVAFDNTEQTINLVYQGRASRKIVISSKKVYELQRDSIFEKLTGVK